MPLVGVEGSRRGVAPTTDDAFPVCRYFGAPERESAFCEDCLVPCSPLSAAVGPHAQHTVSPLLNALATGHLDRVFRTEAAEYFAALAACERAVSTAADRSASGVGHHLQAAASIDAQIAQLLALRAQHVEAAAAAAQRAAKDVAKEAETAVHVLRLGRHRLAHAMRHTAHSGLRGSDPDTAAGQQASLEHLSDEVARAVEAAARRMASAAAATAEVVRSTDDAAASVMREWAAVVEDAGVGADCHADRDKSTVRARASAGDTFSGDAATATTDEESDDSNWCFHDRARHVAAHAAGPRGAPPPPEPVSESPREWLRRSIAEVLSRRPADGPSAPTHTVLAARPSSAGVGPRSARTHADLPPRFPAADRRAQVPTEEPHRTRETPRSRPPEDGRAFEAPSMGVAANAGAIVKHTRRLAACHADAVERAGADTAGGHSTLVATLFAEIEALRNSLSGTAMEERERLDAALTRDHPALSRALLDRHGVGSAAAASPPPSPHATLRTVPKTPPVAPRVADAP